MQIIFYPADVSAYYATRVPDLLQRGKRWRGPCKIHRGKHNSFSANSETGLWRCWSDCGRGGDIIHLEMALTGAPWRDAVMAIERIIGRNLLDSSATAAERRASAGRRAALAVVTKNVQYWRPGRIAELEKAKADFVACGDESGLGKAARALHNLDTGAGVVAAYREHQRLDAAAVRTLIDWAREDERHAEAITSVIVNMIAKVEEVRDYAA